MKTKKKILVIGASSKIGSNLIKILKRKSASKFEILGTYNTNKISGFEKLDITNQKMSEEIITRKRPDVIILTAALIHPLTCEENKKLAWRTNVEAVRNIVKVCKKIDCKLVFYSSDYVYDGKKSSIKENDKLKPLNYYGKTKVEAEKIVSTLNKYLILRTAWVNDVNVIGKSFTMQVIESLQKNEIFEAAVDQYGHPTYSYNLAEITVEMILNNVNGIYHTTGSTFVNRYELAKNIAKAFCLDPSLIKKIKTKRNSAIKRPLKVNLDLTKLKSVISTKPMTLDEQLNSMRKDYDFKTNIRDVFVTPIRRINDERGSLSVLSSKDREDAPNSKNTKEVYLTEDIRKSSIRASHKHGSIDEAFTILEGSAKFVLVDDRKTSSTYKKRFSVFLNNEFRAAITVPAGVYHIIKTTEKNSKCLAVASKAFDKKNPDTFPIDQRFFGKEFDIAITKQVESKIKNNQMYKFQETCRLCNSKDFRLVLDLGEQPPSNALLNKKQVNSEYKFPLRLFLCKNCYHLQLRDVVDKGYLFSNYVYITSANETMVKHFKKYSEYLYKTFLKKKNSSHVIEIGSNDGTLLKNFLIHDVDVLGIEPAKNLAKYSKKAKVRTITDFFSYKLAKKISKEAKADIIIANNVLGHIDDLTDFIKGISVLLENDGVFVFEVPHSYELLKRLEFDTIYHEHISYFSITALERWFKRNDLEIFDVKKELVHGGTIRVFVSKQGRYKKSESVRKIRRIEENDGMKQLETYDNFSKQITLLRSSLREMIFDLKDEGYNIFGYGAPAKGNVLLNYCNLDNKVIDFIVDVTSLKHNKLSPGTHIPIRPSTVVPTLSEKHIGLLLAWNYKSEILEKEKMFRKNGGKFLIPIPKPSIIK